MKPTGTSVWSSKLQRLEIPLYWKHSLGRIPVDLSHYWQMVLHEGKIGYSINNNAPVKIFNAKAWLSLSKQRLWFTSESLLFTQLKKNYSRGIRLWFKKCTWRMLSLDLKDLFVPSHYLDAAPQGACPCTDINQYARRKKGKRINIPLAIKQWINIFLFQSHHCFLNQANIRQVGEFSSVCSCTFLHPPF